MAFKVASKPALNKDGYAKVTFKNVEEGTRTDKTTGEIKEYTKLIFSVMDTSRSNPLNINLFMDVLGTVKADLLLTGLGFEYSQPLEADEDGFGVESIVADEDGFDVGVSSDEYIQAVCDFLEEIKDKNYLAKVERNGKGYWELDINTLKPFTK